MLFHELFTYVPPAPPPEMPRDEPVDPNEGRALTDPYRGARRAVVASCAFCLAWATAQFSTDDLSVEVAGISLNLENASVPILLGIALVYFAARSVLEYGMMARHVRRWPLAQWDFRMVSVLVRLSLMILAAGALDRSSRSLITVGATLSGLLISTALLGFLLLFFTMPIRLRARKRAGAVSVASAAAEAVAWALVFAVGGTVLITIVTAGASYWHEPVRQAVWHGVPDPFALSVFGLLSIAIFLSPWLLRPLYTRLFAERPPYWTERLENGDLALHWIGRTKERLF